MEPTRDLGELTASERRVELAGVETRSVELEGDGEPVLLLHGFADSADTWRPLLERLAVRGRAAAAIDLTGFGTASALDLRHPLLPQWDDLVAAAVEDLSQRNDGEDVTIVGNSLGGCLAMRAAEDPELPIAGIVPIAPAGLHMARWFPLIEGERLIRLLRLSPVPVPEVIVREVVGRVYRTLAFHDQRGADAVVISSFARHIGTVERGMAVLDVGRRLLPELESPFDLKAIECPLLLVWGERDRMVYTAGAERVLRTVDYSDIEVIPDCGHCPQVEEPDLLAELLEAFPESLRED
jgi:pimeloyl-ACP methyl ester carboxylesterase